MVMVRIHTEPHCYQRLSSRLNQIEVTALQEVIRRLDTARSSRRARRALGMIESYLAPLGMRGEDLLDCTLLVVGLADYDAAEEFVCRYVG